MELTKLLCELCNARISWMCSGCKQILCFDEDCSGTIKKLLQDPVKAKRMVELAPHLEKYISRRDAPAHWVEAGKLKQRTVHTRQSCFHYCHPHYFVAHPMDEDSESNDDDSDELMSSITESSVSSPDA